MLGIHDLVVVIGLLCCGITAGVFVAVAVSVVPALAAMPATRYVEMHRLLGRGYHPLMPIVVSAAILAEVTLAVLAAGGSARAVHLAALGCLLGVQVVSHLRMEPVNVRVRALAPGSVPSGWTDPRRLWRSWHRVRTALAVAAFALSGMGAVLIR